MTLSELNNIRATRLILFRLSKNLLLHSHLGMESLCHYPQIFWNGLCHRLCSVVFIASWLSWFDLFILLFNNVYHVNSLDKSFNVHCMTRIPSSDCFSSTPQKYRWSSKTKRLPNHSICDLLNALLAFNLSQALFLLVKLCGKSENCIVEYVDAYGPMAYGILWTSLMAWVFRLTKLGKTQQGRCDTL